MRRKPEAITRDQEFYDSILAELRGLRLQVTAIAQAVSGAPSSFTCETCGQGFVSQRALAAHLKVHKE
jgi:hypothetical protein